MDRSWGKLSAGGGELSGYQVLGWPDGQYQFVSSLDCRFSRTAQAFIRLRLFRLRRRLLRELGVGTLLRPVESHPPKSLPVAVEPPQLDAHNFVLGIRPSGLHSDVEEITPSEPLGEAVLRAVPLVHEEPDFSPSIY